MTLIAIPNVSEGRDLSTIGRLEGAVSSHARLLDTHSDGVHHRSVLTCSGSDDDLVLAMTALADAATTLDLTHHEGAHPRVGVLDVCPIVPHGSSLEEAIRVAHRTGSSIGGEVGLPVYFYGAAATTPERRELPQLRKGGLAGLIARAEAGSAPDEGPQVIDPRHGVVCVGAREVLIAFNVWLDASVEVARSIATKVRSAGDGPQGIRALAIPLSGSSSQVSMNLTAPHLTGIEQAFELVERAAERAGVRVLNTEIVGLVPERFLPPQNAKAARLLRGPGRSLESQLA